MRKLVLLKGSAGCGKSTFVREHNLEDYTLSSDTIRLLYSSPVLINNGEQVINNKYDKTVWKTLFDILEHRLEQGLFTVIDATNSRVAEVNKYKQLADIYRYEIIIVDFTDLPREECKIRNQNRLPVYKRVPNHVIDKFYDRFESSEQINGVKIIKPHEFEDTIRIKPVDVSNYKQIQIIGDIHGCYDALMETLDGGVLRDDKLYVFTGDYNDRGIQNAEVLRYLFTIMNRDNVILLEGNHEGALWKYANNLPTNRKQFDFFTKKELELFNISKAKIKQLCKNLKEMVYLKFNDKYLFVCHGGLSNLPNDLHLVSAREYIYGIGTYEEGKMIDEAFERNTSDNIYQIHGHRNINNNPTHITNRCYCLENRVEFGGTLRSVLFENNFPVICKEVVNHIYKTTQYIEDKDVVEEYDIVEKLRSSDLIRESQFGNISSFNFTSKAFKKKQWNDETIKARGLYINTNTKDIVVRSYDKFFNINEREETQLQNLYNSLSYPVTAYVKYNGYLGLVGYDYESNQLIVTSKSKLDGDYANWIKDIINTWSQDKIQLMTDYVKNNKCTLVFEVIAPKHDTHMIKYTETELVLLSIVKNEIKFEQFPYEEVIDLGQRLNLKFKEKAMVLNNKEDFIAWYETVTQENYKYNNEYVEGFVIEDSKGFMTKIKCYYYTYWKQMRGLVGRYKKNKDSIDITQLTEETKAFILFLDTLSVNELNCNIITLRENFYKSIDKK